MIIIKKIHFLSVLILGISSSIWAVFAKNVWMPIIWLFFLSLLILTNNLKEFKFFIKRFLQIGITLIFISFLQIIFRRQGHVLISVNQFSSSCPSCLRGQNSLLSIPIHIFSSTLCRYFIPQFDRWFLKTSSSLF